MAYWLLKTEPEEFSWDDQVKRGKKGEPWGGVRNFTARRHLKEMKKDDRAFFYHTGNEKQIVGIAEVIKEAYPDPTAKPEEPWVAVTTVAVEPMPKPVTLAAIKADGRIRGYGTRQVRPPVGAAGDRCPMEGRMQDGWADGRHLSRRAAQGAARLNRTQSRSESPGRGPARGARRNDRPCAGGTSVSSGFTSAFTPVFRT